MKWNWVLTVKKKTSKLPKGWGKNLVSWERAVKVELMKIIIAFTLGLVTAVC